METTEELDRRVILKFLIDSNRYIATKAKYLAEDLQIQRDNIIELQKLFEQGYDVTEQLQISNEKRDKLLKDLENIKFHSQTISEVEDIHKEELFP